MTPTVRTFLVCVISLIATLSLTAAQKSTVPPVSIEGRYDDLTVGKPSGDLEGMRVILIDGGGGIYAIVQQAEGGAELPAPALAEVNVKGTEINFSIQLAGHDQAEKFSGKVSAAGLRLQSGDQPFFLKRKKC